MTNTIIALAWAHWLADFVLQSDQMARNKSTSNFWLLAHVWVYSITLAAFFGWEYALINGLAHAAVDACTSRINSRLWKAGKVHYFFVGVGFDQALHFTILFLTIPLIRLTFS